MKIETPGTVIITAEGMTLLDFAFTLDPDELGASEEELKTLATLVCMKWTIETIVREVDALNPQKVLAKFPGKDLH